LKINTQTAIVDASLEIFNLAGEKVQQVDHITANPVELNRNGLPPGCYILHLSNPSGNFSLTGKMLVE